MARVCVVHYGEIGVKGKNRPLFERRLRENLVAGLRGCGAGSVRRGSGRIVVDLPDSAVEDEALARVSAIPGVVWAAAADLVDLTVEAITARTVEVAAADSAASARPFRIDTRRSNKLFPAKSADVNRVVGAAVQKATGRPVDLSGAGSTYSIEIGEKAAFVFTRRVEGPGGLPVGVSGRLVALVSGGLDSPVAAHRMMRRGAEIVVAHFWNDTVASREVVSKIEDLSAALASAQGRVPDWIVPFGDLPRAIVARVPDKCRMLVYRRVMFRLADRIRDRERAGGLVTGDSLGQVASQTLENIGVLYAAARPPVFAPLAGSDKSEIVAEARRIGTYDVSIRPYPDCCSFLVADHPQTRATLPEIEAMEAWEMGPLLDAAMERAERRVAILDAATRRHPSAGSGHGGDAERGANGDPMRVGKEQEPGGRRGGASVSEQLGGGGVRGASPHPR